MANLSMLEKQELLTIFNAAKKIKTVLDAHSDSIHDVVFKQIDITTQNEDENTLIDFMFFISNSFESLQTILDKSELLKDHFIPK